MHCSVMMEGDDFKACHQVVPPRQYYDNCVRDNCLRSNYLNEFDLKCIFLSVYAMKCAEKGIIVDWMKNETHSLQCGEKSTLFFFI